MTEKELEIHAKKKELSRSILAKIMIIEYYRPALFSRMAQMSRDGELSNQIEIAEIKNDKVTEDNIFYSCKVIFLPTFWQKIKSFHLYLLFHLLI